MKTSNQELRRQLAKKKSNKDDSADEVRIPYIPFLKDRVQLSQDALEARANKEAATTVHKRNPHTTYLSEIESFIDLIQTVSAAQEAAKAAEAKVTEPVAVAVTSIAKSNGKPGLKTGAKPGMKSNMLRKPNALPSRALPSGPIVIK